MRYLLKQRLTYAIVVLSLTPLGFSTKFYHGVYANWVNLYAGDILYPMFCFFLVLFFLPQINPVLLAAGNLLFDIFIELSQLITLPFLLELRSSFLGSIIFGSGFDFFDFFYYILGNVLALRLYFTLIRFIRQR